MDLIKKKIQINTRILYKRHPPHTRRPLTLTLFQKRPIMTRSNILCPSTTILKPVLHLYLSLWLWSMMQHPSLTIYWSRPLVDVISLSLDIIKGLLKNHCCIYLSPLTRAECKYHCAKEPKLNNLQVLCPLFLLKFFSCKRLEDAWIMWGLFACEGFVIPNPSETTLYFHTIKFLTFHVMS
jgi:hypothetical protein